MYKFVERESNKRLSNWYKFRHDLETDPNPLESTAKYFNKLPKVKIYTDPYDQSTWPTAWQLIDENEFCPFNLVLGICYTLQLTERFEDSKIKISISVDKTDKTVYYLLFVDDKVFGYNDSGWISVLELPKTLIDLKIYHMSPQY